MTDQTEAEARGLHFAAIQAWVDARDAIDRGGFFGNDRRVAAEVAARAEMQRTAAALQAASRRAGVAAAAVTRSNFTGVSFVQCGNCGRRWEPKEWVGGPCDGGCEWNKARGESR